MRAFLSILFSTIILSFISCEKSDDNPITPQEFDLLTVRVPNNFFKNNSDMTTSGAVFLTDESGEVILSGELSNNSTTTLSKDFDILSNKISLTFVKKFEHNNGTSYRIETFNDVGLVDLTLSDHMVENSVEEEAIITLNNTGGYLEMPLNSRPLGEVTNNLAEFKLPLERIPDDIYFTVKHENEEFRRYVLVKDIVGGSSISFEFNELPIITNSVTFTYPENDEVSTIIWGADESEPNYFYGHVGNFRSTEGVTSHNFSIPEKMFESYEVYRSFSHNGFNYETREVVNSLNLNYEIPTMHFEVTNNDFSNYSLAATGDFDYYLAGFNYFNENDQIDIIWGVYGEDKKEVNFKLPYLEKYFQIEIPGFSLANLENHNASISKLEGIDSYVQFILSRVDLNSNARKAITRNESVGKSLY